MASPTYSSGVSNAKRGVLDAESGLNVESVEQSWSNEKAYLMDRYGGPVGFAYDFDERQNISVTGEISTPNELTLPNSSVDTPGTASDILHGTDDITFGSAAVIANLIDWQGSVSSASPFLDDFSVSMNRGEWISYSGNFSRITGVS